MKSQCKISSSIPKLKLFFEINQMFSNQEICLKLIILHYMKYMNTFIYYCMFKFPTFDERHKKKFVFLKREKLNAKVQKMHIFVCFCSWERILTQDFIYGTLRVIEKKPHVAAAIRTDQSESKKNDSSFWPLPKFS